MTAFSRVSWSCGLGGSLEHQVDFPHPLLHPPTFAITTPHQTHTSSCTLPCTTPWLQHCSTSPTYTFMHCCSTGVISATVSSLTHPHSPSLHSSACFGANTDPSQCNSNASHALITFPPLKLLLVSRSTARACFQCARCPERSTTTNYGRVFGQIQRIPGRKSSARAHV